MDTNLKKEIEIIKLAGEAIGYSHLMQIASALWRRSLQEKGFSKSDSSIIASPNRTVEENYDHYVEEHFESLKPNEPNA